MKIKYYFFLILLLLLLKLSAQESWKQFRGNNRNGSIIDVRINDKWVDSLPKLAWKKIIGSGFSEILISKDKVFTMSSIKTDSTSGLEFMVAFNADTGDEIWKTQVDSMFIDPEKFGDGPRSTPAIDDKTVYCLSSFGKLTALSLKDGKILWKVNFLKEFESIQKWTYTTSPILYENELIIEVGGTKSRGFASFDKKTGKSLWFSGNAKPSYSSPIIATIDGDMNIIFANDSTLISFDKTGKELWSYSMPFKGPVPMPVFVAPDKIFVSSSAGVFMIRIEKNQPFEVFNKTTMRNVFSTSCYYNGYIYGISNGSLKCISAADGVPKWAEKGFGLGSLTRIDNKLLVLTDNGILKLVEAVSDAYSEKGSFQALTGKSWTAPSFANGRVFLRNLNEMVSYKLND